MSYEIRMCLEEAVEIVLKDEALDICAHCKGVGWVENEPDTPESLVYAGLLASRCPECNGNIASFKAEYIEACVVLGKEVPRLKDYVTAERMQKNPNYKPCAQKLIDIQPTATAKLMMRFPNIQSLPKAAYWGRPAGSIVKIDS